MLNGKNRPPANHGVWIQVALVILHLVGTPAAGGGLVKCRYVFGESIVAPIYSSVLFFFFGPPKFYFVLGRQRMLSLVILSGMTSRNATATKESHRELLVDYLTNTAGERLARPECGGQVQFDILSIAGKDIFHGVSLQQFQTDRIDFLLSSHAAGNCYIAQ